MDIYFMEKKLLILSRKNSTADGRNKIGLERLIFFSDAVFAIAVTLLAMEVRIPELQKPVTENQLFVSILSIWPKYLGYFVSFLVIGFFWIGHHRKFRMINKYDHTLLFINLVLLMVVAFIPFPTSILSEYGNRTATIFYAITMASVGIMLNVLWLYSSHQKRLIDKDLDDKSIRQEFFRSLIVPMIFLLSIGLSFIQDDLAKFSWILVAILFRII
jgi:uncharacterized membrane protein